MLKEEKVECPLFRPASRPITTSAQAGARPKAFAGQGRADIQAGEPSKQLYNSATASPAVPGTTYTPVTGRQVRDLLDQLEASSQLGRRTVEQTRQSIAVLARAVPALTERELR
jgi:hypothetical protein